MTNGRRIAVLINPMAGGNGLGIAETIRSRFSDVTMYSTDSADHARNLASGIANSASPPDWVVAIGGDGTVGSVVDGLTTSTPATDVPALVVAPGGTGNSNYCGLWGDLPWTDVLDLLATSDAVGVRHVDLVNIDQIDRRALLGTATGLLPAALEVAGGLELTGRERLLTATILALESFEPFPIEVAVDGDLIFEGPSLFTNIGGFRHRSGVLQMLPHSIIDDGVLDICVIGSSVAHEELAAAALGGDITTLAGVVYARGLNVSIARTDGEKLTIEHDGELRALPTDAYEANVSPGALKVLVPAEPPSWFKAN